MQMRRIVSHDHLRLTHQPCPGGYLNTHPICLLTKCFPHSQPLLPGWFLSLNWRSDKETGHLSPTSNLSLWQQQLIASSNEHRVHLRVWLAPPCSYPAPVERPSQVIPSPQWKHPHRRLWAQLQLVQDGEDPAHLQTYWGARREKRKTISHQEGTWGGWKGQNAQNTCFIQWSDNRKPAYFKCFQNGQPLK